MSPTPSDATPHKATRTDRGPQAGPARFSRTAGARASRRLGPRPQRRALGFLQAGDSVYPLDALRLAGVDLTTFEPVTRAFAVLETLIDRLDTLIGPGPLR